ncbi:MAG: DUF58 domain-containing protein [Bryobacterales bacterium]|nr:DUF58 domain-containing protein [Bryobacteraceae bacterium]MDW8356203.1 DUF58 domain-containing protein [Bryobacterales bacterium]
MDWLGKLASRRRVTTGGLVFVGVIAAMAFAAVVSANNLLFLILSALLATFMVSSLIGQLSLAGLELDFRLPEHVSAGRDTIARLAVRNLKRWTPSFSVRVSGAGQSVLSATVYFPLIRGGTTVEENVTVRFARRGMHRHEGFKVSTGFPFGFLDRSAHVALRRDILVYPRLDPHPGFEALLVDVAGEIAAHFKGRGHDFYRIRPYEPLESVRYVDWKATAHTGELQVREFAREQEPLVEIFLDLDVPAEAHEWFDRAVDCTAFLAWRLVEREARLRFSTQEFKISVPATGDIYTILRYLAVVAPRPARPPAAPDEEHSYRVVFTARPQHFRGAWGSARIVHPGVLLPAASPVRSA